MCEMCSNFTKRHQNGVINMTLVLTLNRFCFGAPNVDFEQVKAGSDRACLIVEIDSFYRTLERGEPGKQNFQHDPTVNHSYARKKYCLKIFFNFK